MKSLKVSGVLLYLFGLVLAMLLYFTYVFVPLGEKIDVLNTQHERDSTQLSVYETALEGIDGLRAEVADLTAKLELARENVPIQGLDIADDVRDAVKKSGSTLLALSINDAAPDASGAVSSSGHKLYSVGASAQLLVSQQQLTTLLAYLEKNSPGAYYVNQLSATAAGTKKTIDISVTLYYFAETEGAP